MDVVFYAADGQGLHAVFARNAADVSPKALLNIGRNYLAPLLGREDAMKQRGTVGMGHDGN